MIGKVVSHYKILEKLGEGGMGVVYKAEDTRLKRPVALKFLPQALTTDLEAKERFTHEAQAASALDHPNICSIYEINESDDGQMFMALACYEGETLKKKIERGPLPIDEAVNITRQVAQGLSRAHEAGIIHRDIKPANIMLAKDGVAKILDFGLAKVSGQTLLTKSGATLGTAAYMSPEQARSEAVDARTDIWSLGVVLYEMLAGKRPFESDYEQGLVYSILNEEPKAIRDIRPDVPEALEKITRRAMAKEPNDRFQVAAELIADIEAYQAGSKLSGRTERIQTKKWKLLILTGSLAVIVIAVGLALFVPRSSTRVTSLAVLPFVNVSRVDSLDYLCDALTDEVTQQLGHIPDFQKIIAYNAVMRYKDRDVVPSSVAEALGVDALVMTRVHQEREELVFRVELVNARDNTRLWGEAFRGNVRRLSQIPRTLSSAIAGSLGMKSPDGPMQRSTGDEDAYKLLLLGRYYYHKTFEADIRRAMVYYRQAIEVDPSFARAYVGLVECYNQLATMYLPWAQVKDSAWAIARQAMELDSSLADAHHGMALVRYLSFEQKEAEPEFLRAITLNPSYAEAFHNYGHFLAERRVGEKAIAMMQRSVDLEPASQHYLFCLGLTYKEDDKQEEALELFRKVHDMDTTSLWAKLAYSQSAFACLYSGKYQKALEYIEHVDRFAKTDAMFVPVCPALRACVYVALGRRQEALKQLSLLLDISAKTDADPYFVAIVHSYLGEKQKAIDWLEVAYKRASNGSFFMYVEKAFEPLREEPRYKELLRTAGYID
jgi:serine/threonine protein kinase/Tfp pilus assembly protein PilF